MAKKKSASDQSATSGNTFIAKKRCAEEMVEQPLAGLESKKTKRPWHFTWFFTACLNATKPVALKKKKLMLTQNKKNQSKLLIAHEAWCELIRGRASTTTDINSTDCKM